VLLDDYVTLIHPESYSSSSSGGRRDLVHKIRYSEPTKLDDEQLKSRTITALDRLGHQRFTLEPGGYSLENWIKGVNLLLDDFEEKVGVDKLSPEYVERRRELSDCLCTPINVSEIDTDIDSARSEEDETLRKLDGTKIQFASRINELQDELARRSAELEAKKKELPSNETARRQSESLFRRIFSRNSAPANDAFEEVKELESEITTLSNEMHEQQRALKSIERHPWESPCVEEWKKLQVLQAKLERLESEKSEKLQLAKEREELTTSIANAIARIP